MPVDQFEDVMDRSWAPVKLEGEAIPDWLSGIPSTLIHSVYASGTRPPGLSYSDSTISSAELLGTIEVYRNAPDDPVDLNRDWYPIIRFSSSDTMLLVRGPISDSDHWLDSIPDSLSDAEILAVPPVYSSDSPSS
jgi:hypothetical protein